MRRQSIHLLTGLVLCLAAISGCSGQDKSGVVPPPLPELPPPNQPLPEEIAAEIQEGLKPLDDVASFEAGITPELKEQLITHLKTAQHNHSGTEWDRKGLMLTANGLEDRLEAARENMHTDLVLLLCDLIEVIEPDNTKLPRFREWAQIQLERPIVKIVGWFEFEKPSYGKDEIYALLEVYIPATGKTERPKVMEGEEFLGLKFHRIIGKKRGMVLEYLKTKDKFAVYGPGNRAAILNANPNS
ncbi:MAG TPA: hypothetical protein PLM14_05365 [Candidatus Hydrogenedentes bacterium]|nr:hypothetical protein [Candidatus Hydrogenedentota bacterium]HQE82407.1 hypothetical protein [Candidatus Hydrogenedentota bacterium]HQM48772.1 hypothetical protein [Candidatus Hydrogenedentota bacterium]